MTLGGCWFKHFFDQVIQDETMAARETFKERRRYPLCFCIERAAI